MTYEDFTKILISEFGINSEADFQKLEKIAYESAKDAHREIDMTDEDLLFFGREFLVDAIKAKEFGLKNFRFC